MIFSNRDILKCKWKFYGKSELKITTWFKKPSERNSGGFYLFSGSHVFEQMEHCRRSQFYKLAT